MSPRPNLALFTFGAAAALSACERRVEGDGANAVAPMVAAPAAKGVDAPVPAEAGPN
ncbi:MULTISPECIES: hypothetical protein [Sphingomonas]|jgi:alpha/beta superfamily hydrolase|uniref:hypothetical protein n=1 Tax=Sphingomonas TaxID=13687 RepID=UPI000A58D353|nr:MULTISPECIES: hypothetical protein [Sphingomonas]MBY0300777.1 hypothetical protein [Sphingomonas ginsenosidimutans]